MTYFSNGSNMPFAITKSRHSGLSPATFPRAHTAWNEHNNTHHFEKEFLILDNFKLNPLHLLVLAHLHEVKIIRQ